MNYITLDFTGIKSSWDLHEYFKEVFALPDYYGHNMDALWDCLYCCYDNSTTIILKNISALPKQLKPEIEIMLDLFRDLNQEDGVIIKVENNGTSSSDISDYLI